MQTRIVVDDRESRCGILEIFNGMESVSVSVKRLASGSLHRHGTRPRGKRKTQLHILQGLPGIGSERAGALLDKFGSIEAILTARAEELASIRGIGGRTVKAIHWAVHETGGEYGTPPLEIDPAL